jgi:hypothetical protein
MIPEILNSVERHLSFKELLALPSIDAARQQLLDKEVESFLRASHADQFKWMENKLGVVLTKVPSWPHFIEITERRNLFVHCNGVVSGQYLSVCSEHKVDCSGVALGDELDVTTEYFETAYATIVEIGVKLAYVVWRRLRPDEMEAADRTLNGLCLDLIRDEKYEVAKTILDFATSNKKFGLEYIRRVLILNRAQAYKWSGQDRRAKELLETEDWRAASEVLQLGTCVLRDDFKAAGKLMRHIGPDGSPSRGDYKDWPIFKVFRTSPEFATAFEQVFGEPFGETAQLPEK